MSAIEGDVRASFLYLSEADVESCAPDPLSAVELAADALRAVGRGDVQLGHDGVRSRPTTGFSAMTGFVPDADLVGLKWVSESASAGVFATVAVNDPEEGGLRAVLGGRYLTGLRTAAVSGACVRALAAPGPIAIVGTGLQARTHLVVLEALGRRDIRIAYRTRSSAEALARWAGEAVPMLHLELHESSDDAVRDAAAVITMVTRGSTTGRVEPSALPEDALLLPIDFAHCIDGSVAASAALLAADDVHAYEEFRSRGELPGYPPTTRATGLALDAERPPGRAVVVNVGNAAGDLFLSRAVLETANDRGIGVELPV